jgi:hypothetical protein
MKRQLLLTAVLALILQVTSFGQSIKLNNESDPGSAMLEVSSTSKGILIPNVTLTGITDATTIATPVASLLVYNTATVSDVIPGYYYNSGTAGSPIWIRLSTSTSTGTAGDGSETKVTAGTNVTVTGSGTSASLYIVDAATSSPTTYTIGLSAEQGGYIFWVSTDGKHGLVAETVNQGISLTWYDAQDNISNPSNHSADGQNFRDWRLPTKFELNEMWKNLHRFGCSNTIPDNSPCPTAIGGFSSGYYWSSTEYDNTNAWTQGFNYGSQYPPNKNYYYNVRAVRAF